MSSNRTHKVPVPESAPEEVSEAVVSEGEAELQEMMAKELAKSALKKPTVGPIQVVATRAGFYKQSRKAEGDKFTIAGENELGDWMKKI